MTHWAIALYERYVQLYGEPIEQPITSATIAPNTPHDLIPPTTAEPRAQPSAPRSS